MMQPDRNKLVLVFLANTRWNTGWSSRRRLAEGLADEGWPIYFSSGPLRTWQRGSKEWTEAAWRTCAESQGRVTVERPGKWHSVWPRFRGLRRVMERRAGAALRENVTKLYPGKDIGLVCYHPMYSNIAQSLRPARTIYVVYDDLEKTHHWSPALERAEDKLLEMTDLVVGYSEQMVERIMRKTSAPCQVMPLGVDFRLFETKSRGPCPEDLASIPRPRMGWVGNINDKIDFDLIHRLVEAISDINFVFIGRDLLADQPSGPANLVRSYEAWQRLKECHRVHVLGAREHDCIPRYMANIDINAMPYDLSSGLWVESCYPLKMHEYLSVGNPVLAADVPAVRQFKDVIDICVNFNEWMTGVQRALREDSEHKRASRQAVAAQNDWAVRIKEFSRWIESI